jgi:hypothetical protein
MNRPKSSGRPKLLGDDDDLDPSASNSDDPDESAEDPDDSGDADDAVDRKTK